MTAIGYCRVIRRGRVVSSVVAMTNSISTTAFPTIQASPVRPGTGWNGYAARWRRTGREAGAIVAMFFTGTAGFAVAWALFSAGLGVLPLFLLGVFVLAAALYAARAFGEADLRLLEWAGMPRIERPAQNRRPGFGEWLRTVFGNLRNWLALIYALAPQFALSLFSFVVLTVVFAVGLGGATWPIWGWAIEQNRHLTADGGLGWVLHRWLGGDQWLLEGVIYVVVGLALLAVLPFVTRALVSARWLLARALLGAH